MNDLSDLDLKSNSRFVQFQLWRNCNCNCDFCYNKGLKDGDQLAVLPAIYEKMQDPLIDHFNEIGLIGGELLGKQLDNDQARVWFYKILELIVHKIKNGKCNKVYITSALLFKDKQNLIDFLFYIKENGVIDRFLLCTSYDTIYRFKNEHSEQLWVDNMNWLHDFWPELKTHTETILTNDFISKVLDNEFNIKEFEQRYHTKQNFIIPQCNSNVETKELFIKQLPNFLPERAKFIKFMHKIWAENQTAMHEFLNEQLHSDLLYLECGGYLYEFWGRRRFPTLMDSYYRKLGRSFYHLGYADSPVKMEDDVRIFKDQIGV